MNKLHKALDLCNQNKFDDAIPILEEITRSEPGNSDAWRTLAQVHWLHNHNANLAYDELIEALKANPRNLWALILMGNILTKERNDVESAKTYYDKVLEYYPDNAIAINNVAATYMERKEYDEAIPLFKKILAIGVDYANAYYGLALCYYKKGMTQECFDTCFDGARLSKDRPENPGVRDELLKLYLTVAHDLVRKTNYINVWKAIKDELEMVDGVPIKIVEDSNLNVHAKLEYALHHASKEHVIKYNPNKEYVDHLFIHEMMHLKMQQRNTAAGKGKLMVHTEATRSAFSKRYLNLMLKTHKQLPRQEVVKVVDQMGTSMGLQLLNCPLDLLVEREMYDKYRVVRPVQLLSLFKMETENIEAVKKGSQSGFFPKEIVRANKVMNMVTCMHFKDMYGIDLLKEYNPTKAEYDQAKDLFDEFKAYLNTYQPGDEYEMLEYFVQSLQMEDFVELMDESDMTSGMKADVSLASDLEKLVDEALPEEEVDVANAQFALDHQDGADPGETMMMTMYMLGAMEYFDTLEAQDVHRIALEIATVGVTGINPKKSYSIKSIPDKEFGGYQFLAYYYVSWARAIPHVLDKLGLPFTKAYENAIVLYNAKHGKK